jgi:uncharacterized protein (TIGR02996 family)
MTEREALLRAVCNNPDDDTSRLVFADWLQENGEEARAEFIRLQVRLAELLRLADPGAESVGRRAREYWLEYGKSWLKELPQIKGVIWYDGFTRGFVERVEITSDAILVRHADLIFSHTPLVHLVIKRFEGVEGFASLAGLGRLRTLAVTNPRTDTNVLRELLRCDMLAESMILMCYFGPNGTDFYHELYRKFGTRLFRPPPPQQHPPGAAFRR